MREPGGEKELENTGRGAKAKSGSCCQVPPRRWAERGAPTSWFSLGFTNKSRRQRHRLRETAPPHHIPRLRLVYGQTTALNTGQVMLVITFAEPCSHISRLFGNTWLAVCHVSTETKRTQTMIGIGLLQLMSKDTRDSTY